MDTNALKIVLLYSFLMFGFFGCATTEGPFLPEASSISPAVKNSPIVLLDKELKSLIGIDYLRGSRDRSGVLVVDARFQNRKKKDFTIEVQTLFFDASGKSLYESVGNPRGWDILSLKGYGMIPYRSVALSGEAAGFKVQVRRMKRR